jgi:hypothetical protein
VAKVA